MPAEEPEFVGGCGRGLADILCGKIVEWWCGDPDEGIELARGVGGGAGSSTDGCGYCMVE